MAIRGLGFLISLSLAGACFVCYKCAQAENSPLSNAQTLKQCLLAVSKNRTSQEAEEEEELKKDGAAAARFTSDRLKFHCHGANDWLTSSISKSNLETVELDEKQLNWLNSLSSCRNLKHCQHLLQHANEISRSPTASLKPAKRREIRMLERGEWKKLLKSMNQLKNDTINGLSKYDIFAIIHSPKYAPGAHFGPAFLPFHRELLKKHRKRNQMCAVIVQLVKVVHNDEDTGCLSINVVVVLFSFELALRVYDEDVSLPYWDSSLDEGLPNAADSVLWSDEFFGNGDGYVSEGPFKNWLTLKAVFNERKIVREVRSSEYGSLYNVNDFRSIQSKSNYEELTNCVDPFFELLYGGVTLWVGGHMKHPETAAEDPVYFFHQCFTDYLWEQFREKRQTEIEREIDFVSNTDSCNRNHYADALMKPFLIKNSDGLSNIYTDEFYFYDKRPTCSAQSPDCGSDYLFCDTVRSRCMSKIKLDGNCTGFQSFPICIRGVCIDGKCKDADIQKISFSHDEKPITKVSTAAVVVDDEQLSKKEDNCYCNCDCSSKDGQKSKYMKNLPISLIIGGKTTSKDQPVDEASSTNELFVDSDWVWILVSVVSSGDASRPAQVTVIADGIDYEGHYEKLAMLSSDTSAAYEGTVPVQVRNPSSNRGRSTIRLQANERKAGGCKAYCYSKDNFIGYKPCSAEITLFSNQSNPLYSSKLEEIIQQAKKSPASEILFREFHNLGENMPKRDTVQPKSDQDCRFLRFEHSLLVGYADAVKESLTLDDCKAYCQTWKSLQGKPCASLMHWVDDGTCILLTHTRNTLPHVFVYLPKEPVTYLERVCGDASRILES
ncbi:putative tyrosinase-like protein tyr-3 [Trichinella nativa]|uniref:Tyrosinase-like protein tyr-3 n=1 Tax=Trichinella nativa TaxID=6335 RepID=A0A0V1KR57_9BILA|nr:putative tyrosinase-like protein tyr-3 [Trichinella nativa]